LEVVVVTDERLLLLDLLQLLDLGMLARGKIQRVKRQLDRLVGLKVLTRV